MNRSAKYFGVVMVSLALIATPLLAGCGRNDSTTTPGAGQTTAVTSTTSAAPAAGASLSGDEMQQIVGESTQALQNAGSYKFDIAMHTVMATTGGDQPGSMDMVMEMNGVSDVTDKESYASLNISIDSDLMPSESGTQNVSTELYVLTDYVYMKTNLMSMDDQWLKVPLSEEAEKAFDLNMVDRQVAALESLQDVEFLRFEDFDGSECYVFHVVPDMGAIMSWIGQEIPADVDMADLDRVSEMFKELSYTLWIARDTGLLKNIDSVIRVEIDAGEFASGGNADFDTLTADMNLTMALHDYNGPVDITLPPEAANAFELPGAGAAPGT